MDREQLDGGDSEPGEMVDDGRVGQSRIGAAYLFGNVGVAHRDTAHMGLVYNRLVEWDPGMAILPPVKEGTDHHRPGHRACRIRIVRLLGVVEPVGKDRLAPGDRAVDGLRVGVEQQLGRVGPLTRSRLPRAVDPEAVSLPGDYLGEVGMPHEPVALGELDPRLGAVVCEEAELYRLRHFREDRYVRPGAVEGGAERVRLAGPDLHHPS